MDKLNPPVEIRSSNDTDPQIEVAMPGIGGEVKVALIALSVLEERLTRELSAGYKSESGQPLEMYIQGCAASVMMLLAHLPRPAYDVPIMCGLVRLAINALLDFQLAIRTDKAPEKEGQKSTIPIDDSLKAV